MFWLSNAGIISHLTSMCRGLLTLLENKTTTLFSSMDAQNVSQTFPFLLKTTFMHCILLTDTMFSSRYCLN